MASFSPPVQWAVDIMRMVPGCTANALLTAAKANLQCLKQLPFHDDFPKEPIQMTAISVQELYDGIHSLPQEIYDIIYNNVFSVQPNQERITETYKPPIQLHIDHATRTRLSPIYYGTGAQWVFDDAYTAGYFLPEWFFCLPSIVQDDLKASCFDSAECRMHFPVYPSHIMHIFQIKQTGMKKPFRVDGVWLQERRV